MKEKTGLWKTESKKGTNYYSGKIKINGKEYYISIFKNEKKKDNSPDLMLYMNEKEKKATDEQIYAEFGNLTEIDDSEIAF